MMMGDDDEECIYGKVIRGRVMTHVDTISMVLN
jgi:hypothetical protein